MKLTVGQYLEKIVHLGRCYIHQVVSDIIRINIPQVDTDLITGYEILPIG
jgi:hypothetical protein